MSYIEVEYPREPAAFYATLTEQLALYTAGEPDRTARLANASAVLAQAFDRINWAGFYLTDGDALVLGPFQGKPAVTRIGRGKGVCGTAWAKGESQVVEEVSCFPGHIVCDCASRSEIVIPLRDGTDIWGVLDMDSAVPGRFSETDRAGLEQAVKALKR